MSSTRKRERRRAWRARLRAEASETRRYERVGDAMARELARGDAEGAAVAQAIELAAFPELFDRPWQVSVATIRRAREARRARA